MASKILLAGVGPIPPESPDRLFAPGLRVWIFAEELARAGHVVDLAVMEFGERAGESLRHFLVVWDKESQSARASLVKEWRDASPCEVLREIGEASSPNAVVALTDVAGNAVARAKIGAPVWFDFLGSPMAERQQQAAVHDHDGGLAAAWALILPCLLSGDRFSACAEAQRLALIGELAACGRLNRLTAGHDLARVIPPGSAFADFRKTASVVRGAEAPEDAVIVLWAGGFNTWTDIRTLHAGLAEAMGRDERLHFVSFGGAIPGHCEGVYPEFERLVAEGPHNERFHLMGWVDPQTVQNGYLEADLAINIDCFSYEGLLGTRSRLLEWMRAGLAIVTTELCELSEILIQRDMAYSFSIGDPHTLADTLCRAASNPDGRKEIARRASVFLDSEYTNKKLLEPLVEWAADPRHAGDIDPESERNQSALFPMPDNALAAAQMELAIDGSPSEETERLRAENERRRAALARLQGSRLVRLFARWKGFPIEPV